jgi:hypothetical protein
LIELKLAQQSSGRTKFHYGINGIPEHFAFDDLEDFLSPEGLK